MYVAMFCVSLACTGCGRSPDAVSVLSSKSSETSDSFETALPVSLVGTSANAHGLGSMTLSPAAKVSDNGAATQFSLLTAVQTGVDYQMQLPNPHKNIKEYMLLSVYGGICTGDYDADGLSDFYVTSPVGGGRLYRNLGGFKFQDVTQEAGIELGARFWGTGATFVDINNDGRLDLYLCSYRSANKLFINEQTPTGRVRFVERAEKYGLNYRGASMTMAFADIDNDGDLDGYLATTGLPPPPNTKFQVRFENGKPIVLDHLREYWELIYLPGDRAHRTEAGQFDHLYRNDGDRFTEITEEAGIDGAYFTLSATWWDYNGDNRPDLYASNDFLGPDSLYENTGEGRFSNVIREVIPHTPWFSMGSDIGDVNNDGLIDFLATDMSATTHYRDKMMMGNMDDSGWFLEFAEPRQYMRNALYLNTGGRRVMEAAFMSGIASTNWTWNPRLADFDNDGKLDLFITNGVLRDTMNSDAADYSKNVLKEGSQQWVDYWAKQPMFEEKNLSFRNSGDLKFENTTEDWGLGRKGVSFGAATADFDNDGDLDLVVNNADAPVSIYRNNAFAGNSLRVALVGTKSNRFGIGATVSVEANGTEQVQYVTLARGWLSACDPTLHFGLGDATAVERITIKWPSGITQEISDVDVNQLATITEPKEQQHISSRHVINVEHTWFESSDILATTNHKESEYDDFAEQPLLPNRLSMAGPAMAWGDVNGDGHLDSYLGGSRGRPGTLLLSSANGTGFISSSSKAFADDEQSEDIDALFFDADGDGDADLYVVSGSNEAKIGHPAYSDRLYINQGTGRFKKKDSATLRDSRESGSVVVAADFDLDGDQDLFVGSRCIPGRYPETPRCQLLVNDGGNFVDDTPAALAEMGLVTDATWVDVDANEFPDLVVSTDWGPIKLFRNQQGQLADATEGAGLVRHAGWWNSVATGDIDRDGDIDFLATNFGLNTKYKASHDKPELLYYGDVDGSGERHIIEAKFEGEICYPRRGFSCSRAAMPLLEKHTKTFHAFASSTLFDLYADNRLEAALRFEANELRSGVFLNDGAGRFEFRPLPRIAQIAPCTDACLEDLNNDGNLDIVLAQNFYGPQRETGHMDGGVGLVLAGSKTGAFTPLHPSFSGIRVSGDARRVRIIDINGDQLPDLVFALNNGPIKAFLQSPIASELDLPVADGTLQSRGHDRR